MSIISFAPDVRSLLAKRGAYSGTDCTMKKIKLTKGKFALVDDEDYPYLNSFKWFAQFGGREGLFYAVRTKTLEDIKDTKGQTSRAIMHRVIMGLNDSRVVDHLNGDGLDNRKSNLRVCSQSENQRNLYKHRQGRLVGTVKKGNRYKAQCRNGGRNVYLGTYDTEEEAHKAFMEYQNSHALLEDNKE